jgi:hypothetical protein
VRVLVEELTRSLEALESQLRRDLRAAGQTE